MFTWNKLGLLYDLKKYKNKQDWCYDYAQGINTLMFSDYIRIYFCCREKPDETGKTISRVTYVDVDKDNPLSIIRISDHPCLELGGLGEFDEFGTYPFSAIRCRNKIYGYYGGVTRCESVPFNVSIGLCESKDGDYFAKIGSGPVLSYSYDEPFVVCSPKVRIFNDKWYLIYSAGYKWTKGNNRPEICYKLRMAISDDGINWTKLHRNLIVDKLGDMESQACGDIIYKNGKYHMFFCYRNHEDFRKNPNNSYRIGYAYSKDLVNWVRNDELAGIDISNNKDDWDSEMVAYPHIFEPNGKTYMLYLGNEVGKRGFGIAVLNGELA